MRAVSLLLLAASMLLSGCSGEFRHPDVSAREVRLHVKPFYKDMMEGGAESPSELSKDLYGKYGSFYSDFCKYELRIGEPCSALSDSLLGCFLSQPENAEVMAACDSVYGKLDLDADISDAFSCFGVLFPQRPVPGNVFCHFSFFNSGILVDSAYVSFAIERYLGSDCRFYEWLELPVYARRNRRADFIVSDLVKAWILSTMPETSGKQDVLTSIIYQAKVLYALHCCIPSIDEATLFGMTKDEVKWCAANESNMWGCLVERKLLYSTDLLDRNKIVNDAPFTFFFGNNSPGRAALYCGYNIVRGYMKSHPDVTPEELMAISDAQSILQGSKYNP